MKTSTLLFALSLGFVSSCADDFFFTPAPLKYDCDYDLGTFKLNESSIKAMPYEGKSNVVFRDTLGNEIHFRITSIHDPRSDEKFAIARGDKNDFTMFCYITESQKYELTSDESETSLVVDLAATPFGVDPYKQYIADKLYASVYYPLTSSFASGIIFTKLIDQRTYPVDLQQPILLESYSCFGRIFQDVEYQQGFNSETVFFNLTEGIVSFRDHAAKKWCFERFE